jgi:hypothetical protein
MLKPVETQNVASLQKPTQFNPILHPKPNNRNVVHLIEIVFARL